MSDGITFATCPHCRGGETILDVRNYWTCARSMVISATVRHFCVGYSGLARTTVQVTRVTEAEAVEAWRQFCEVKP